MYSYQYNFIIDIHLLYRSKVTHYGTFKPHSSQAINEKAYASYVSFASKATAISLRFLHSSFVANSRFLTFLSTFF